MPDSALNQADLSCFKSLAFHRHIVHRLGHHFLVFIASKVLE